MYVFLLNVHRILSVILTIQLQNKEMRTTEWPMRLHKWSQCLNGTNARGHVGRQIRPDNMADENSFRLHAPATGKSIADTRCRVICARGSACTMRYILWPLREPEAPAAR